MDADSLLAGPRGRRLCVEFALPDDGPDTPEGASLREVLFWASHQLESAQGRGGVLFGPGSEGPFPEPSVADVADALGAVPLPAVDTTTALLALRATVDRARYWQEPDGTDELMCAPEVKGALRRVAAHIVASSVVEWWTEPVGLEQWSVAFRDPDTDDVGPQPRAAAALSTWRERHEVNERRARRERPMDPTAPWGGEWWSQPPQGLRSSTRAVPGAGPVRLWCVEDTLGWTSADVHRVRPDDGLRVYEIAGADAWARLCADHPLDVTASRRQDWYRTTGRVGSWVIPDWAAIARDWDAVHLTAAGYLSSAGTAIPVGDGVASVIAGWAPDQTYWLVDVASDPGTRWFFDETARRWSQNPP